MYSPDAQIESAASRIVDIARAICKDDFVELEVGESDSRTELTKNPETGDESYLGEATFTITIRHRSVRKKEEG